MIGFGRKAAAFAAALAFSTGSVALPVAAQELKIGIKTEPSALDPQFHTLNPNIQVARLFLRCADRAGCRPQDAAGAGAVVEGDRRHDLGIQAAPQREVP